MRHRHPPAALAWTPAPADAHPGDGDEPRAGSRIVAASGIVFDLPVGVRTTPRFAEPLAAWLDPGLLLAGVDLPPDTAGLLEVNGAFVEALLVGANHELARELLWRGVPARSPGHVAHPVLRVRGHHAAGRPATGGGVGPPPTTSAATSRSASRSC